MNELVWNKHKLLCAFATFRLLFSLVEKYYIFMHYILLMYRWQIIFFMYALPEDVRHRWNRNQIKYRQRCSNYVK